MIHLTDALTRAVNDLKAKKNFNGFYFVELRGPSPTESLKEDYLSDGYPIGVAETAARDYALICVHLDTYADGDVGLPCEYVDISVNTHEIEKELREFFLEYLDGDESLLPDNINVNGYEMEFVRQGPFRYGDRAFCIRDSQEVDGDAVCVAEHEYDISGCLHDGNEWLVEISGELHRAADFERKSLPEEVETPRGSYYLMIGPITDEDGFTAEDRKEMLEDAGWKDVKILRSKV